MCPWCPPPPVSAAYVMADFSIGHTWICTLASWWLSCLGGLIKAELSLMCFACCIYLACVVKS